MWNLMRKFIVKNQKEIFHQIQQKKIMILLQKIFEINGFKHKSLISDKNLRYKGQNTGNRSMMFVLFFLYRDNITNNYEKDEKDKFIDLY